MELTHLVCYGNTSMRGLKIVRTEKYVWCMMLGKHDSRRMPCWTWQECALWLNIPVSRPAIGGVLATQGVELNIAHFTGRMCLFENSIPLWVLLWESFYIHTHTILNPVCLFLPDSLPSRTQQLFSLHNPITAVSDSWLVTSYLKLNKRRGVFSPPVLRPPRLLYL